jgi:hypothetical protein
MTERTPRRIKTRAEKGVMGERRHGRMYPPVRQPLATQPNHASREDRT